MDNMDINISVIDDFFVDIDKVLEEACTLNYHQSSSGTWNGKKSKERLSLSEDAYNLLSLYIPFNTIPWERATISEEFWGEASIGSCSLLVNNQSDTVHFHLRSGLYAAVIYLCNPPKKDGFHGISFYLNNKTSKKYCDIGDNLIKFYRSQERELDKWTEWHSIRMKKNRAIMFNARFFHRASNGFGSSEKDGRLVNMYSFDVE